MLVSLLMGSGEEITERIWDIVGDDVTRARTICLTRRETSQQNIHLCREIEHAWCDLLDYLLEQRIEWAANAEFAEFYQTNFVRPHYYWDSDSS